MNIRDTDYENARRNHSQIVAILREFPDWDTSKSLGPLADWLEEHDDRRCELLREHDEVYRVYCAAETVAYSSGMSVRYVWEMLQYTLISHAFASAAPSFSSAVANLNHFSRTISAAGNHQ